MCSLYFAFRRDPAEKDEWAANVMGANEQIKHYDLHPPGEPLTLFSTSASKATIVARLLEARWLVRASTLLGEEGRGCEQKVALGCLAGASAVGRRYDHPIEVRWDGRARRLVMFVWRRRRYPVDEVLAHWVSESYWWEPERRLSRAVWRVRSGAGIYDLYLDRLTRRWYLGSAVD